VFNINNAIKTKGEGKNTLLTFECSECGVEFDIKKDNIYTRKTTCCIKCSSLVGLRKINITDSNQRTLTKLRSSAAKKNIECTLTLPDIKEFIKQDVCTYCDTFIDWSNVNRYNLDRKDNDKGYIKDNLTVCCWNCNNTKSNRFTHEEFIMLSPMLKEIIKLRNDKVKDKKV